MPMETDVKIKDILEELLARYGFSGVSIEEQVESGEHQGLAPKVFSLRVPEEDSRFLIGQFGNNLQALQHIARAVVARKMPELSSTNFVLDVNEYRKKKDQLIMELARSASREAQQSGETVYLRPMSAYDRRLVHMELAKEQNVVTESVGSGMERRIAVKPLITE